MHSVSGLVQVDLPANDTMSSEKIDEIVKAVFQFFKFAKRDGIQQWIYEEKVTIEELALNNLEKEDPLSIVRALSVKMQTLKIEYVVDSPTDKEFRAELIEQLIDHLTPENMRITLISKVFEGQTDRKEKYYGINYSYEQIAQERIDRWTDVEFNENLKIHTPNEYIPTDLELVERESEEHEVPQLIKQDRLANVWFLQDNKFKTPRAFYGIYLRNGFFKSDPAAQLLLGLYCQLLNESLQDDARLANQAGIIFSVSRGPNGLIILVYGYNEKLHIVLGKIVDALVKFEPSRQRFEKRKALTILGLKNAHKQQLDLLLNQCWSLLLTEAYSVEEQLDCMDRVTFEELHTVRRRFFSRMFVDLFVHGNVTRADAELVESLVTKRLIDVYATTPLPIGSFIVQRALKLDDHSQYVYQRISEEHHENLILNSFQVGLNTPAETCKVHLLVRLLKQRFFHQLRTEEQLGYSVFMLVYTVYGVLSINFRIRSSYSVQYLDERIQKFIRWAADHLAALTDEEFATYKESLRQTWSEPVHRQTTDSLRLWNHVKEETLDFVRNERLLNALEGIGKEDVIACFNEHLIENPRKLSIRLTGTKAADQSESQVPEVPEVGLIVRSPY